MRLLWIIMLSIFVGIVIFLSGKFLYGPKGIILLIYAIAGAIFILIMLISAHPIF